MHINIHAYISQGVKPQAVMAIATKYIKDIQVMFSAHFDTSPHMITTSGEKKKTDTPKKEPVAAKVEAPAPAPKKETPKSEPVKVPEPAVESAPATETVTPPPKAASDPSTDDDMADVDADSVPAVEEAES